jgi:hypothetical protein
VTGFILSSSNSSLARDAIIARTFTDRRKGGAVEKSALRARCRLKEAKTWFTHRGWEVLPRSERGWSILRWGADHAWTASTANPKRSVSRWCRRWAPWLSDAELNEIITASETSNKRWSDDQSAGVLEISVKDREKFKLWHFGANDDPFYVARHDIKRTKAAERSRRYRAKKRTGAKPGRPPRELSADDKLARSNAQAAKRMRQYRALRKTPSSHLKGIDSVTEFSVTHHPLVSVDPPTGPRSPPRKAPSFDQPEPEGVVIELAASYGAVLSRRQQLQERARLCLNEVTGAMMRSDDPAIWQPLLIAATSEWRGHNLLDA